MFTDKEAFSQVSGVQLFDQLNHRRVVGKEQLLINVTVNHEAGDIFAQTKQTLQVSR